MKRILVLFPLLVFISACLPIPQDPPPPSHDQNKDGSAQGEIEDEEVIAATPIKPPIIPSIIFHNGEVLTMEDISPIPNHEAIAIAGRTILAVGTNREILDLKGSSTELVDLDGRTLMPGFIEGHSHVLHFASRGGMDREQAMKVALSYGLTTLNELLVDQEDIDWLLEAEEHDKLLLRVNAFPIYNQPVLDSAGNAIVDPVWYPENDPILDSTRWLRIPGIKIFGDGAYTPGRGCPALTDPYPEDLQADPDYEFATTCFNKNGDLYFSQDEMNRIVAEAQARGFRVTFHVMGDRGIEVALTAVENALAGESNARYRHAIHHNSLLTDDQVRRYRDSYILASVRAYFNTCDQDEYSYYFGSDRYQWAANRYTLIDHGLPAFSEGDFAWGFAPDDRTRSNQLNPLVNLFGLVTRKQLCADGVFSEPAEWLHPNAISVEQALRMLTINPAYAVSQEHAIGTLEQGKFADLIILSDNPLTVARDDIIGLEVWMTMVDGLTAYCAEGHEDLCP